MDQPPSGDDGRGSDGQKKRKRPESPVAEDGNKVPRTQGPQQANLSTANTQGQQGHLGVQDWLPGPSGLIWNPILELWTAPPPNPLPVEVQLLQQALNQQAQSRMQMTMAATASVGGQGQQQVEPLNQQTALAFLRTQRDPAEQIVITPFMLIQLDRLYQRDFLLPTRVPGENSIRYRPRRRGMSPRQYLDFLVLHGLLVPPPTTTTATTAGGRAANQEEQAPRPLSDRADTDTRPLESASGAPPRRSNVDTDAPAPTTGNDQSRDPVANWMADWMAAHAARGRRAQAQADNGNQGQATSPLHDQPAGEQTEPARAAEQQPESEAVEAEAESGHGEEEHDLNNDIPSYSGPDDISFLVPNLVYGLYPSSPRSDGDNRGQAPPPARGTDRSQAFLDAANDAYAEMMIEGIQHGAWEDMSTGQFMFARNMMNRGAQTPHERILAEILATMPRTSHEAADQDQGEEATVGSETQAGPASTAAAAAATAAAADNEGDETIDEGEEEASLTPAPTAVRAGRLRNGKEFTS